MSTEATDDAHGAAARIRAATALRRLSHALVGREPDPERLDEVAAAAEALLPLLESTPVRRRPADGMRVDVSSPAPPDGAPLEHFADCPVSGAANPLAVELHAVRDGDTAVVRATLGPAHEGAPGRAHGGYVAALFDDAMGFLTGSLLCEPAYVVDLRVRYLAPTPVGEEVELRAWVTERRGRTVLVDAEARHRGRVVARATGAHVVVGLDATGPPAYPVDR